MKTSIADHAPGHVVDHFVAFTVICRGELLRGHGKANSVGNTLAERTSGDLDTFVLDLRMAGADGVVFSTVVALELVGGHALDADKMHEKILP